MGYGFGCDDSLLYQLKDFGVTKPQLHAYLHHVTKLASLTFLKFLHVDIEAIGRHHANVMAAFNAANLKPGTRMLFVVPPQFFWFADED